MTQPPSSRLSAHPNNNKHDTSNKEKSQKKRLSIADIEKQMQSTVFGKSESMAKSGVGGGTPMLSRPGKSTIAEYLCFSNGVKQKEYMPTDPMDFTNRPLEQIKERLRLELNVLNKDSTRA